MNGRTILGACLAVVALSAGVGACGDDEEEGNETFDEQGFEVTFEYPADFDLSTEITADAQAGEEAGDRAGIRLDDENGIVITRTGLNASIDAANLADAQPQIDALVAQVAGRPIQGEPTEVGGLPALSYAPFQFADAGLSSRLTVIFDGAVEYQLNCQWNDEHRAEIEDACELALGTLRPKSG